MVERYNLEVAYGKHSGLRFVKPECLSVKQFEELTKLGYIELQSEWWVCIKLNQK